jgi:hypothetical protein
MTFHGNYDAVHPDEHLSPEEQRSRAQSQHQMPYMGQSSKHLGYVPPPAEVVQARRQARKAAKKTWKARVTRQRRIKEAWSERMEILGPLGLASQRPTQPVRDVVSGGIPSLGKHHR